VVKVLLVDDEEKTLKILSRSLTMFGYVTMEISDPRLAVKMIKQEVPDVVIADLIMPHISGIDLLDQVMRLDPDFPVIVLTGYGSIKTAVEAMRKGAFDYITKPYNINEVDVILKRAIKQRELFIENKMLRERVLRDSPFSDIITQDAGMKKLFTKIKTLANTDSTVLISGESGTGKELIARALHLAGNRRNKPFITIDCSGLPENILESEIFGHIKGAFTGAYNDKKGYLEVADRGSVFFDEIGELPLHLQRKLLRVTQEKEFSRVGDTQTRKADIRIIAATNRDLRQEVKAGNFREDLFYRLDVMSLQVPPLRDRPQDIPLLMNYFLLEINAKFGKRVTKIEESALHCMMHYAWPGNVRELKNSVEKIVAFKEGNLITIEDIPRAIHTLTSEKDVYLPSFKIFKEETLGKVTKEYVLMLLMMFNGNVSKASAKAEMDRANFRKLLRHFEISAKDYRK